MAASEHVRRCSANRFPCLSDINKRLVWESPNTLFTLCYDTWFLMAADVLLHHGFW